MARPFHHFCYCAMLVETIAEVEKGDSPHGTSEWCACVCLKCTFIHTYINTLICVLLSHSLFSPTSYPSFTLHVAPPSVSVTPSEPVLSVGDTLTLTCTGGDCVGNTTFAFSWLLDGRPVNTSLVTAVNVTSNTSQLSVTSVTSADFGTYTCQVTSVHGTGTAVSYVQERGMLSWSFDLQGVCIVST